MTSATGGTPSSPEPGSAPGGPAREPALPAPQGKRTERGHRGWTLTERVLAIVAGLLSVATGVVGLWGAQASADRDELETRTDALIVERDKLGAELAAAEEEIAGLRTTGASTTTTTTTATTAPPPDAPPPGATYLNELDPVSGSVETGETELGGQRYLNVVRQDLKVCGTPDTAEFNLGQDFSTFTALVGLHDTVKDPTDLWRFVVTTIDGDGEHVVFQEEVPFAQPAQVAVSVDGAQRLRLEVVEVDIGWTGSNCLIDDAPATWAEPLLTP